MAKVKTFDGQEVELKTPSKKYWEDRAEQAAIYNYDKADNSYKDLKRIFRRTTTAMNKEISGFYAKYGRNIQAPVFDTLEDGTQVQTGTKVRRVVTMNEAQKYNRLTSLEKQLNSLLTTMAKDQDKYMVTNLRLLAQDGYNYFYYDMFKGYGVGYRFDLLDPKVVSELIRNPVHGSNFSKRVWKNKQLLASRVNEELANGLIQGISTREMSKRVSERMNAGYKVAERLMRTEITNTYNQATLQGYKDSGFIDKYIYLATLDSRTSDICIALDNKSFAVKDAKVGLNYPPMHVNCRSTTIADFNDKRFNRVVRDKDTKEIYRFNDRQSYENWKANSFKPNN